MKKITICTVLFITLLMLSQTVEANRSMMINGYEKKISGVDFSYHSSIKSARECMLIRATNGSSSMEWQTAPVPFKVDSDSVSFIWLAGLGSSPGLAGFDLEVNQATKFTFWVDGSNKWKIKSKDGAALSFSTDKIDQHGDRFGFMVLSMPKHTLISGEPLNIKVTGGKFDLTSWYMTFKFPIESGVIFQPYPALSQIDGNLYRLIGAGIFYVGEATEAKFFINNSFVEAKEVNFGYNYLRFKIPEATTETNLNYIIEIADKVWEGQLVLQPVKRMQVNFVQHTHTDIGYTRSQTDILGDHLRYIDYALDYCDKTENYPDDSKFKWTCEVSWAVDEYLKCRPKNQIDRLLKRIAQGRIEVTGMYLNFDELPDEQTLAASLQPIRRFKEKGIDVKTAMQNDVNGIGWALNEYFSELGVKYLNMGTHGHRALICFDKPTLFWWESPSGKRMLAYRGEHYMIGNTLLKIHDNNFDEFEEEMLLYLQNLEAKGYEYDIIALQHSGFITDNSPPSTTASDMIRLWNEKYTWPKLKTALASEFFETMENRYENAFQTIRGAWPDWWTDGFGASAREVAAIRNAQSDLIAYTAGITMAALRGTKIPSKINERIEATNNALLFYTEHTVGYHASVREPFHKYTMELRAIKESYAWEAWRRARMIGEETLGQLQSFFEREKDPTIIVFNTLSWQRSGLFTVYIDYQTLPRNAKFSITSKDGSDLKAQAIEHHSDGAYWSIWVDSVPAFGHKKLVIRVDKDNEPSKTALHRSKKLQMENQWYKVETIPAKGIITSIYDKDLSIELVDQSSKWKMGEFIHEQLANREELESFFLKSFTRSPLDTVWFDSYEEGQVWNTIRFKGNTEAALRDGAYIFEIRLFNTCKRIDLAYAIEKKLVTEPEAIYNALPFTLENGTLAFDVTGGEIRAGIDQIPGSANDWNTVQNYARLSNDKSQIILSSQKIPLMQFGGINTGRFKTGATPETNHIFGWPMNNYWTTNFNADQHGGFEWSYSITSILGNKPKDAIEFGWGNRTPLIGRVIPGGGTGNNTWEQSWISNWSENLLFISAIPDENGSSAIFLVRETDGTTTNFSIKNGITGKIFKCVHVDATGIEIKNGNTSLKPFESKFFRVMF